jgi:hypothetical protein
MGQYPLYGADEVIGQVVIEKLLSQHFTVYGQ